LPKIFTKIIQTLALWRLYQSKLVADLQDLHDPTLLPNFRALYDHHFVDKSYAGTYEDIKVNILEKPSAAFNVELQNVFKLCEELEAFE